MNPLLVNLVAIHGTDVDTTSNLALAQPEAFTEDIWKLKFNNDFPSRPYFEWWSSEENYRLQQHGKMWICWTIDFHIDNFLYAPNPIYKRLLEMDSDAINYSEGYSPHVFFEFDFTVPCQKYIILKQFKSNLTYITSFMTFDQVKHHLLNVLLVNVNADDELNYFILNFERFSFDFAPKTNNAKCCSFISGSLENFENQLSLPF